jgi:hypothetical protein
MHIFKVYDGENHWYAASCEQSAIVEHLKQFYDVSSPNTLNELDLFMLEVEDIDIDLEDLEVSQLNDSESLSVKLDYYEVAELNEIDKTKVSKNNSNQWVIIKTAGEWASESADATLIASTVY